MLKPILLVLSLALAAVPASAQGHGPVFGYATPTNSKGEWSFDEAVLARDAPGSNQGTIRSLIGYGITPHLTLSLDAPLVFGSGSLPPTRILGGDDFEGKLAWRFQHRTTGVGTRFESTAFAGFVLPGPQNGDGLFRHLARAPGFSTAAVTGIASRSHYLWLGGGYTRYLERDRDRRPGIFDYSLVYGYRPPSWRKEPDKWDWRLFAELTGEKSNSALLAGRDLLGSYSNQTFLGPSVLGIRRNYAIEGGIQFPVFQDVGSLLPKERFRIALNLTYFLFPHHDSH